MPGILELDQITTYRGPAQILRGVSLAVGEGEAVCLVGRNGAGKTTTIDSIMGLLPVRGGKITRRSVPTLLMPENGRRNRLPFAPKRARPLSDSKRMAGSAGIRKPQKQGRSQA